MPITPNILLQANTQAKTQAASANPSALAAEPGDKASSFAQVYANQAQNKPSATTDGSPKPVRDKAPDSPDKKSVGNEMLPPRNRRLPIAANPCPPTNRRRATTRRLPTTLRRLRQRR